MKRALVLGTLAACGAGASKPTPYTHEDPTFTIDLPPGFSAQPGDTAVWFAGPHPRDQLTVEWLPADTTAVAARDGDAHLDTLMNHADVTATGDLLGGGAWYEVHGHPDKVVAYLVVGSQILRCETNADAALDACKSLRP